MGARTLTDAERADVAECGRLVRRMELDAMRLRQESDKIAAAGNVATAGVYLAAATGAEKIACDLKDLWGRCEGFAEGYIP